MSLIGEVTPKIELRNLTLHIENHMSLDDLIMQIQHFVPGKIISVKNNKEIIIFDKNSTYPEDLIPKKIISSDFYNFNTKNGDIYCVYGQQTAWNFLNFSKNGKKEIKTENVPENNKEINQDNSNNKRGVYFSIISNLENEKNIEEISENDMSVRATILTKTIKFTN
jgi:hypothetical protein